MEVNLILCNSMCLGFSSCNDSENIFRCLFCPIADFRLIDDGKDIPNITVYMIMMMMVLMFVVMMVLMFVVMRVLMFVIVMVLVIMVMVVMMLVIMVMVVMMLVIMVMMMLRLIQNNVKIAGIDTIFLYSTDFQLVTRQIKLSSPSINTCWSAPRSSSAATVISPLMPE